MTTRARNAEADQAAAVFHYALVELGVGTIEDALELWDAVSPVRSAAVSQAWLRRAVALVMTRRRRSRAIAMSYYRLVRALRTGNTIADPRKPEPPYVTLDMLRREFAALAPEGTAEGYGDPVEGEDEALDQILVEELDGLQAEEERLEREAEEEARIDLEALGTNNLDNRLADIDDSDPASSVDESRNEAHRKAGAQQAATAERIAMDGARSTVWRNADLDKRALGYARVSRTGTPCGWCAMLISRGAVYKSRESASRAIYGDGDKYHDYCHCYAEPVFSRAQYAESDLFALNRKYKPLWKEVTEGLSGKAALTLWRRFIRQEQRTRDLASRSTSNVQEA